MFNCSHYIAGQVTTFKQEKGLVNVIIIIKPIDRIFKGGAPLSCSHHVPSR